MNNLRTTLAVTTLMVFGSMALAPMASASPDDDLISRTFYGIRAPLVEWKERGVGWYDPTTGNLCLFALAGIQNDLGSGFYYENLRIYGNLYKPIPVDVPPAGPVPLFIALACPGPLGAPPGTYGIVIPDFNVIVGTLIDQDAILCSQGAVLGSTFTECLPDATSWDWDLTACDDVTFTARVSPSNKGTLGGTGLEGQALSSGVATCAVQHGHDVSEKLNVFEPDSVRTFFTAVPAGLIVHPGHGHAWVVSCLKGTVTQRLTVSPFTTVPGINQEAHDWALVLDVSSLLNPSTAAASLADAQTKITKHLGLGAGDRALQGLYDLGGDNANDGAPDECPANNECPQEDKKSDVSPDPTCDVAVPIGDCAKATANEPIVRQSLCRNPDDGSLCVQWVSVFVNGQETHTCQRP